MGVRVVHHPDPTDAVNLVHKIKAYGVTLLVGTPTFVRYILERATPGSLTRSGDRRRGGEVSAGPGGALRAGGTESDDRSKATASRSARRWCRSTRRSARDQAQSEARSRVWQCVLSIWRVPVLPAGRLGIIQVSGPTVFPGDLRP